MDGSNFLDEKWWDWLASNFSMSQLVEVLPNDGESIGCKPMRSELSFWPRQRAIAVPYLIPKPPVKRQRRFMSWLAHSTRNISECLLIILLYSCLFSFNQASKHESTHEEGVQF